ncbi:MAG TPA: 16S rRNA (guanine(966)-N(2))-methyltransferase RsmD [Candidatus Saccharimonadales bacterium]|jgi:16S rRNA (guanine966-N2)-methyltransferase|nr:16S rRNA (guanine(966)-N(2))-methyltransferase RsmD [Candidatus Saccharimonadales bacterium]
MRIIAGRLGGRQFAAPKGHRTRPMSDKMRGALFNSLGDITGLSVLDAFAGSGALSFEALSRGGRSVLAIDSDPAAQRTIADNVRELRLGQQLKLIKASANAWLSTTDQQFDVMLADPPYDDIQFGLLTKLADRVKPGGIMVYSLPPNTRLNLSENYELLTEKTYGDSSLTFYRRN